MGVVQFRMKWAVLSINLYGLKCSSKEIEEFAVGLGTQLLLAREGGMWSFVEGLRIIGSKVKNGCMSGGLWFEVGAKQFVVVEARV